MTRPPFSTLAILSTTVLALGAPAAQAQDAAPLEADQVAAQSKPKAYAILVGNNAGGPGQEDLRYAESDARRMLKVLVELGGYELQEPRLLLSPAPLALWNAFESVQEDIEADDKPSGDSVLFFYYSGHARSKAIDLGPQQVALADLRSRIEAMPTGLRVVVLDACQSGAISRVKGTIPASDFSTNSVASLTMHGMAIMASSTGTELSQESDALSGSYFTHHLVSGLRGAADKNGDGSVTLSEAYEYAYDSTLLATAVSAVGKQHVTLETDLRGKGDIALTRPADADARLLFPAPLSGAFTVSGAKSKSVVAEINKPKGKATIVALPKGPYKVLVRTSSTQARQCAVNLKSKQITSLVWDECAVVAIDTGSNKGGQGASGQLGVVVYPRAPLGPLWSVEASIGLRSMSSSGYTDRLETFGYEPEGRLIDLTTTTNFTAYRRIGAHLQLGASTGLLDADHFTRHTDGASTYELAWTTYHLSAAARVYKGWRANRVQLFAEATLGATRARSRLTETEQNRSFAETHYGFAVSGTAGAVLMPLKNLGLVYRIGYGVAPTLTNELDETHTAGGVINTFGLHAAF